MKLYFTIEKLTKGAVRYTEVSEQGAPVNNGELKVGTLYFRKTAFPSGDYPDPIVVTVEQHRFV